MKELIDKAAIVEWIKRGGNEYPCDNDEQDIGYHCALYEIQDFLDTLETKEVDLEKEYKEFINCNNGRSMFETAKHFFELGLFSTLTWQDVRLIAEIGNDFMNSEESDNLTDEAYYGAILDKVMEKVREEGRDAKTSWSENRKARGE